MSCIRVAPTDHKNLQVILQGVLHKAVGWAEIEDVVLVDLRRHDQQRLRVLLPAHRAVLDQLQPFVAKDHRTLSSGHGLADFEGVLGDLAGQSVVVQQIVYQVAEAAHDTAAAGVEQFFDRQRVKQSVGRCHRVVEQGADKVRPGPVVVAHLAVVDPLSDLILPGQVGLQAASVERVQAPCRIGEARVSGAGFVRRFAKQHFAQLATQGQRMSHGM